MHIGYSNRISCRITYLNRLRICSCIPTIGDSFGCGECGGLSLTDCSIAGNGDIWQLMNGQVQGDDGVAAVGGGEDLGVVSRGGINAIIPRI